MTDHVHGEDSYVECDYITISFQREMQEMYSEGYVPETQCYCGADAEYIARVNFHTDTTEETPGEWPTTFSQDVKAHRCEKHGFEENNS